MSTGLDGDSHGGSGGLKMATQPTRTVMSTTTSCTAVAATCSACHREKLVATSCTVAEVILANGGVLPRVRFSPRDGASPDDRCADCHVGPGGLHHLGCDLELCPSCGQQASFCGFRV
jgi:hypothetical protein